MQSISKIGRKIFAFLLIHTPGTLVIPDDVYLKMLYFAFMGKSLDLTNPRTYNEKIQWLKLYNRSPRHIDMVDKSKAKEIAAKMVGEEHVIETLGVWDKVDDVDFDRLPQQFVLKTTHGGGGTDVVVVKDKDKANLKSIKRKLKRSLKTSLWKQYRDWVYKGVTPRIIAEKYMEDETGELKDYKFYCFDGVPKFLMIASERMTEQGAAFDFLDMQYNRLPLSRGHRNSDSLPAKPKNFEKMVEIATALAAGEKHIRIDLYNINGKIYFGEFTFYPASGNVPIKPEEWDLKIGEFLKL